MENEFLLISEKKEIYNLLLSGDEETVDYVINEINRLESIIRNYQSGFELLQSKHVTNVNKKIEPFCKDSK